MEIPFVVHIYISVKNSFSQNNEINHVTLAHREWELRKSNSTKYIDKHIESTHTHTDTHSHRCCSFVLVSVVFSLFQHFICSDVYCFVCLFWFSFSASITLINLWIQQFVLTCRPVLLLPFSPPMETVTIHFIFWALWMHSFIQISFVSSTTLNNTILNRQTPQRTW